MAKTYNLVDGEIGRRKGITIQVGETRGRSNVKKSVWKKEGGGEQNTRGSGRKTGGQWKTVDIWFGKGDRKET